MSQGQLAEVFTVDEVSRAAGVPEEHLQALVASGQLRLIPRTRFIAAHEAIRVGRLLCGQSPEVAVAAPDLFARSSGTFPSHSPRSPMPSAWRSSCC
jgi:hypothetical protein